MAQKKTERDLVFLSAKRTPFGTFGGILKDVNPSELGAVSARAAIAQAGIDSKEI